MSDRSSLVRTCLSDGAPAEPVQSPPPPRASRGSAHGSSRSALFASSSRTREEEGEPRLSIDVSPSPIRHEHGDGALLDTPPSDRALFQSACSPGGYWRPARGSGGQERLSTSLVGKPCHGDFVRSASAPTSEVVRRTSAKIEDRRRRKRVPRGRRTGNERSDAARRADARQPEVRSSSVQAMRVVNYRIGDFFHTDEYADDLCSSSLSSSYRTTSAAAVVRPRPTAMQAGAQKVGEPLRPRSSHSPRGVRPIDDGDKYFRRIGFSLITEGIRLQGKTQQWTPVQLSNDATTDCQLEYTYLTAPPSPLRSSAAPQETREGSVPVDDIPLYRATTYLNCSLETLAGFLARPRSALYFMQRCQFQHTLDVNDGGRGCLEHIGFLSQPPTDVVSFKYLRIVNVSKELASTTPSTLCTHLRAALQNYLPTAVLKRGSGADTTPNASSPPCITEADWPARLLVCSSTSVDDPRVPLRWGYTRFRVHLSSIVAYELPTSGGITVQYLYAQDPKDQREGVPVPTGGDHSIPAMLAHRLRGIRESCCVAGSTCVAPRKSDVGKEARNCGHGRTTARPRFTTCSEAYDSPDRSVGRDGDELTPSYLSSFQNTSFVSYYKSVWERIKEINESSPVASELRRDKDKAGHSVIAVEGMKPAASPSRIPRSPEAASPSPSPRLTTFVPELPPVGVPPQRTGAAPNSLDECASVTRHSFADPRQEKVANIEDCSAIPCIPGGPDTSVQQPATGTLHLLSAREQEAASCGGKAADTERRPEPQAPPRAENRRTLRPLRKTKRNTFFVRCSSKNAELPRNGDGKDAPPAGASRRASSSYKYRRPKRVQSAPPQLPSNGPRTTEPLPGGPRITRRPVESLQRGVGARRAQTVGAGRRTAPAPVTLDALNRSSGAVVLDFLSCSGLPLEPLRRQAGGNAVVSMRFLLHLSRSGIHKETPSVTYASAVSFSSEKNGPWSVRLPLVDAGPGTFPETVIITALVDGVDGADPRTGLAAGTDAAAPATRMGEAHVLLTNLRSGRPQVMELPLVGRAGTPRAKERALLRFRMTPVNCGVPSRSLVLSPENEAELRHVFLLALRSCCVPQLHRLECYVAACRNQSLAEGLAQVSRLRESHTAPRPAASGRASAPACHRTVQRVRVGDTARAFAARAHTAAPFGRSERSDHGRFTTGADDGLVTTPRDAAMAHQGSSAPLSSVSLSERQPGQPANVAQNGESVPWASRRPRTSGCVPTVSEPGPSAESNEPHVSRQSCPSRTSRSPAAAAATAGGAGPPRRLRPPQKRSATAPAKVRPSAAGAFASYPLPSQDSRHIVSISSIIVRDVTQYSLSGLAPVFCARSNDCFLRVCPFDPRQTDLTELTAAMCSKVRQSSADRAAAGSTRAVPMARDACIDFGAETVHLSVEQESSARAPGGAPGTPSTDLLVALISGCRGCPVALLGICVVSLPRGTSTGSLVVRKTLPLIRDAGTVGARPSGELTFTLRVTRPPALKHEPVDCAPLQAEAQTERVERDGGEHGPCASQRPSDLLLAQRLATFLWAHNRGQLHLLDAFQQQVEACGGMRAFLKAKRSTEPHFASCRCTLLRWLPAHSTDSACVDNEFTRIPATSVTALSALVTVGWHTFMARESECVLSSVVNGDAAVAATDASVSVPLSAECFTANGVLSNDDSICIVLYGRVRRSEGGTVLTGTGQPPGASDSNTDTVELGRAVLPVSALSAGVARRIVLPLTRNAQYHGAVMRGAVEVEIAAEGRDLLRNRTFSLFDESWGPRRKLFRLLETVASEHLHEGFQLLSSTVKADSAEEEQRLALLAINTLSNTYGSGCADAGDDRFTVVVRVLGFRSLGDSANTMSGSVYVKGFCGAQTFLRSQAISVKAPAGSQLGLVIPSIWKGSVGVLGNLADLQHDTVRLKIAKAHLFAPNETVSVVEVSLAGLHPRLCPRERLWLPFYSLDSDGGGVSSAFLGEVGVELAVFPAAAHSTSNDSVAFQPPRATPFALADDEFLFRAENSYVLRDVASLLVAQGAMALSRLHPICTSSSNSTLGLHSAHAVARQRVQRAPSELWCTVYIHVAALCVNEGVLPSGLTAPEADEGFFVRASVGDVSGVCRCPVRKGAMSLNSPESLAAAENPTLPSNTPSSFFLSLAQRSGCVRLDLSASYIATLRNTERTPPRLELTLLYGSAATAFAGPPVAQRTHSAPAAGRGVTDGRFSGRLRSFSLSARPQKPRSPVSPVPSPETVSFPHSARAGAGAKATGTSHRAGIDGLSDLGTAVLSLEALLPGSQGDGSARTAGVSVPIAVSAPVLAGYMQEADQQAFTVARHRTRRPLDSTEDFVLGTLCVGATLPQNESVPSWLQRERPLSGRARGWDDEAFNTARGEALVSGKIKRVQCVHYCFYEGIVNATASRSVVKRERTRRQLRPLPRARRRGGQSSAQAVAPAEAGDGVEEVITQEEQPPEKPELSTRMATVKNHSISFWTSDQGEIVTLSSPDSTVHTEEVQHVSGNRATANRALFVDK